MRDLFGEELCREWVSMGGLKKKKQGPLFGSPYNFDHSKLGSIAVSPIYSQE